MGKNATFQVPGHEQGLDSPPSLANQSLQFLPYCFFLVWCIGDRWGPYSEAARPRSPLWGIMGENTKSCSVCIEMGVCIMLTP